MTQCIVYQICVHAKCIMSVLDFELYGRFAGAADVFDQRYIAHLPLGLPSATP